MPEEREKRFSVSGKCLGRNGLFEKEKGNRRIAYPEKSTAGDPVAGSCSPRKEHNPTTGVSHLFFSAV